MNLSRRNLIKYGAIGTGCVVAAGGTAWMGRDYIRTQQPKEIAEHLMSHFDYLKFNFGEDRFQDFAQMYSKHYMEIPRKSWHALRGRDEKQYQQWMDHLAGVFLMSTDFFLNGADESKPINFMTFYNPYISPCWSPFQK